MIDSALYNEAVRIIDVLPKDNGLVTIKDQGDPDDLQRVWAVEFKDQTIILQFVFDDSELRERVFCELLARGASITQYFAEYAVSASEDHTNLLYAFNLVFNQLMAENQRLKMEIERLSQPQSSDNEVPTVGEK